MYLMSNKTIGFESSAKETPPFGPGFSQDEIDKSSSMEIWGSSIKDDGADFCEFKLKDKDGNVIATRCIGGY